MVDPFEHTKGMLPSKARSEVERIFIETLKKCPHPVVADYTGGRATDAACMWVAIELSSPEINFATTCLQPLKASMLESNFSTWWEAQQ